METYERDFYGKVTINGVSYTTEYLKQNLPYFIQYNINTKDYFFVSRSGAYIGHNTNNIYDILPHFNAADYSEVYLFNDVYPPWNNKQYMEFFITRFNEETALYGKLIIPDYSNPFAFLHYNTY